jgi:hypothetical protein
MNIDSPEFEIPTVDFLSDKAKWIERDYSDCLVARPNEWSAHHLSKDLHDFMEAWMALYGNLVEMPLEVRAAILRSEAIRKRYLRTLDHTLEIGDRMRSMLSPIWGFLGRDDAVHHRFIASLGRLREMAEAHESKILQKESAIHS